MSNIAIILCFIPFLLLWWKKLSQEKAYLFVCIYWLLNGLINMPFLAQSSNRVFLKNITILDNLIDTPLALLIFFFAASGMRKKILYYIFIGFIVFQLAILLWKGYNYDSVTIVLGWGIFILFFYSIWGLAQYFQKIEHNPFENVMGFVYAGFIFYDGLWVVIYIFNFLNYRKETVAENQFLNYLSIILATVLTSIGLWQYAKPKNNLTKFYERTSPQRN
jgi:hypothetical protein